MFHVKQFNKIETKIKIGGGIVCKVLMSINPEHVSNILAGTKKYEFRKIKCKRKIESIIIYSTAPEMKVVAEVEVTDLIQGTPNDVWKKTSKNAGIKKRFFDSYFHNRETAFAYCLGKVKKYSQSKKLQDFGVKTAPQSFVYIDN